MALQKNKTLSFSIFGCLIVGTDREICPYWDIPVVIKKLDIAAEILIQ